MKISNALPPRQMIAIRLLASGLTATAVAEELGISYMTLYRWKQNELFSAELNRATTSYIMEFTEKLNFSAMAAIDTLNEIMNDLREPSTHRGKIALGVLKNLPRIQSALAKTSYRAADPSTGDQSAEIEVGYEVGADGTVTI